MKKKIYWKVTRANWSAALSAQDYIRSVFYKKNRWTYRPEGQGELFVFKTKQEAKVWINECSQFKIHKAKIGKIVPKFSGPWLDYLHIYNNSVFTDKVMILD